MTHRKCCHSYTFLYTSAFGRTLYVIALEDNRILKSSRAQDPSHPAVLQTPSYSVDAPGRRNAEKATHADHWIQQGSLDFQGGTSRALQFATTLCTSFRVAGLVTYSSTPAAKAAARSLSLTRPVKAAM